MMNEFVLFKCVRLRRLGNFPDGCRQHTRGGNILEKRRINVCLG